LKNTAGFRSFREGNFVPAKPADIIIIGVGPAIDMFRAYHFTVHGTVDSATLVTSPDEHPSLAEEHVDRIALVVDAGPLGRDRLG
jgi:hypothetical protein